MKRLLQIWQREEAVTPWYDRIAGREDLSGRIRFRGTNGMTGPAKSLAEPFEPKPNSLWIRLLGKEIIGRSMKEMEGVEPSKEITW